MNKIIFITLHGKDGRPISVDPCSIAVIMPIEISGGVRFVIDGQPVTESTVIMKGTSWGVEVVEDRKTILEMIATLQSPEPKSVVQPTQASDD